MGPRAVNNLSAIIFTASFNRRARFYFIQKINIQFDNFFVATPESRFIFSKMVNPEEIARIGKEKHPNSANVTIQYGTAGFRTKAVLLDHVMYRMGVLAVLTSKLRKGTVGVMITASHNPAPDNGVKVVIPSGGRLEPKWEVISTELANAKDSDLADVIQKIITSEKIDLDEPANVFIGQDTRPSSECLCNAVIDGIQAAGGDLKNFGIVSTPQLHYFVVCHYTNGEYGQASEEGYFNKLSKAFKLLRGENTSNGNYQPDLMFDGANGVGADKMGSFARNLQSFLNVTILNDGKNSDDGLNEKCGADFVKVGQKIPKNFEKFVNGERCVTIDGDADRVIYFYTTEEEGFVMLDGDRIATLIAGFVVELLKESSLDLHIGLVQTAYANGSSTKYITETLNVPVACVPTGVKHLHRKAHDYDIGIYFEANGHGTTIFSPKAKEMIRAQAKTSPAAKKLELLMDLINETDGDAISDCLVVETILHAKGWNAQDWNRAYKDLPNRQLKVNVQDRNVIETTDAERKCLTPDGLQTAIDDTVSKFAQGRSFVRPSGTEDVVRVYAEAETQNDADQLAYEVGLHVHRLAGGVGEPTPRP